MFNLKIITNFFKFNDLKTTFRREIVGGITTFLAMIYILSVQPNILSNAPHIRYLNDANFNMSFGGIFIATAISSFLATLIMGLFANVPAGLAPGMGLNAIFTFNVAKSGIGYQGALIAVMFSGIIFFIISVTKVRLIIINAIPQSLKLAISVGIGFFLTFLGLHSIGFIGDTNATNNNFNSGLPIATLGNLKTNWPVILMGFFVLIIIFILFYKKFPGAIAIAIVIGLLLSLLIGNFSNNGFIKSNFAHWKGWNYDDLSGFSINISSTFQEFINVKIWSSPTMYISIFIFLFVHFFDTTGTFYIISNQISEQSGVKYSISSKALISDSFATIIGGTIGCSPVITFAESTTGISQGARTGFASVITALMFLISIVLFPIFKLITPTITGAATIFIGTLMIGQIKDIEWVIPEIGLSSFFTIIIMTVTFSITNGIAVGFIIYTIISLINNKFKNINFITYILDLSFISYFILFAFMQKP